MLGIGKEKIYTDIISELQIKAKTYKIIKYSYKKIYKELNKIYSNINKIEVIR